MAERNQPSPDSLALAADPSFAEEYGGDLVIDDDEDGNEDAIETPEPDAEGTDPAPAGDPDPAEKAATPDQPPPESPAPTEAPADQAPESAPADAAKPDQAAEFRWRADRQDFAFPGSKVEGDAETGSIVIPRKYERDLQRFLADATSGSTKQRLAQLVAEKEELEFRSEYDPDKLTAKLLLSEMNEQWERGGADALAAWLDAYPQHRDRLIATAKAEHATKENERLKTRPASAPRPQQAPAREAPDEQEGGVSVESVRPQAEPAVRETIGEMIAESPDLKHLDAEDVALLTRRLTGRRLAEVLAVADRTIYDERGNLVAEKGQVVLKLDAIDEEVREFAQQKAALAKRYSAANSAAAQNAKSTGAGAPAKGKPAAPPPAVGAQRQAPAESTEIPLLPAHGNRKQYEEWAALPQHIRQASLEQNKRHEK